MGETKDVVANRILEVIPLVMRSLAAEMRRTGHTLSPSHFRVLAHLYMERMSLGELARQICVSPPTISRSITTLQERGWVQRVPSNRDGRVVFAELTPQGRQVLGEMERQSRQWISHYLEGLSTQEQQALLTGIDLLRDVFQRAYEDSDQW